MFANWTLRSKMLAVGAAALAGMLMIGVIGAFEMRSAAHEQRMQLLQALVESTRAQIGYYEQLQKDGKLTREQAQAQAREALRNVRFQQREYFYIYTMDGVNVLHPTQPHREGKPFINEQDKVGKLFVADIVKAGQAGGGFVDYHFPRPNETEAVRKVAYVAPVPDWQWVVGTGLYVDDVEAAFREDLAINLGIVIVLAGVVLALVIAIGRSVMRQVGGEPAVAVQAMKKVVEGDLRAGIGNAPAGSMLAELDTLISRLRNTVSEISAGAQKVGAATADISATSRQVAGSAQQQTDSTQTMAAAMEELTVSITHISENAGETERQSIESSEMAVAGERQVHEAAEEMRSLADAVVQASERIASLSARANEVGGIATAINDIAAQTNLLALNAAIEAARAGEQGRGFAVVADEVRKLAERTTQATLQIGQTVSAIRGESEAAVSAMDAASERARNSVNSAEQSADMLRRIAEGATRARELVAEVANSTREQGIASNSLAGQIEQVAQMVEATSQGMHATATATEELTRVAGDLTSVVSRFRC
ncbi:methyl-accepting chemotaxis protein [Methyloversatilis discipulorum]|uniref:methyl-accepting chemotaxis protein n=1 Tax=Methyloversatilis discipulorum TaxID=1119528 RepID=UPI0003739A9D|nr:cache domain-containing protein [Methyloversatilis discipulorum]